MRNVKIVFMSLMVLMLAGSAWAYSPADHVKIAPNNQGDVLIYPFYAAIDGGYETKLQVVNTSDTLSTVAKLVVRSEKNSEELLDFLIYLSPSDVWTGTLRWDAEEGGPVMYSEDDSILAGVDTFASADNPVKQPLADVTGEGDSNMLGYVYVINAATADLDDDESAGDKVAKSVIYDWYDEISSGDIVELYQPENILAGFMDFNVEDVFLTSGLNAVTLRDYNNEQKLSVQEPSFLGESANNNLFEIEAILSKTDVSIPYMNTDEDVTLHFFNFPTKYTQIDQDGTVTGVRGEFFKQNTEQPEFCVPFGFNAYDLSENTEKDPSPIFSPAPPEETSSFCRELNWIDSPQFAFDEGFTRYQLENSEYRTEAFTEDGETLLQFTGAPVIPVQLNLGQSGLSMKYGSWTDGEVTNTTAGETYPDYHYSDSPNVVEE